ncbi:MAG: hypothetical protein NT040_01470 [Bacteroidetes bacterium]|nr:hypothetical protein [Bacteroidota bacterium]
MKKTLCTLFIFATLFFGLNGSYSQVAISNDGSAPAASAMLEIKATNKGFLPPRVSLASTADVTTIPSPVAGLLVYNTNSAIINGYSTGYYFYTGSKWSKITSNTTHYLGEFYGGGNIFWLDETGEHGLIAAIADLGSSGGTRWYNGTFKVTGAYADGVYAGKYNTDKIITSQGTGTYAAMLCRDYNFTFGNIFYTDWYLPSKYELNLMYQNRLLLAPFNYSYGVYWSSTEGTADPLGQAFDQVFLNGTGSGLQDESPKDWNDLVRCIRKF